MSTTPTRKDQLLAYCQTPRTMAQVLSHFGLRPGAKECQRLCTTTRAVMTQATGMR